MKPIFKAIIAAAVLCLCLPALIWADHKVVETVTVTVAPSKLPRNSGTVTTWIGEDHLVRVDELNNITTIIRRDLQPARMQILFHDRKEVLELELPLEIPEHLIPAFAELRMNWEINRRATEQTIGQWECKKFEIDGYGAMRIDMDIWASVDTTIDTRRFHAMLGESFKATPIFTDMVEKLYSISPYFAIKTTMVVEQLGQRSVTETVVQSITEESTPENSLELPEDYVVRALDFSTYLSMVRSTRPATEYKD